MFFVLNRFTLFIVFLLALSGFVPTHAEEPPPPLLTSETPMPVATPSCVINARDATFAYLAVNQNVPVFIFFTDDSHDACVVEEPMVEDLAREYAAKVRFVRVDASKCFRVIHANKITQLPAFCFVNRPAHATLNFVGCLDKDNMRGFIEQGLHPRSIVENANAKYANHEYKDAVFAYTQATQIDPNNPAVYSGRGNSRFALHDYKGAIQDYTKVIELNPKDPEAYDNRAQAKNAKDDLDGAIADFDKAIEMIPDNADILNSRGFVKNKKGDYDGAIADFDKAIQVNPKLADAYRNRGTAKQAKGDWQGAIVDFQQVVQMGNSMAALDIWVCESRQGKKGDAKRDLSEYLDKNPSHSFSEDCTRQIGSFLIGRISEETLLSRMTNLDAGWKRNVIACHVYYYIAEERLASGNGSAEAAKYFQKATATGETNLMSYAGAMAEIAIMRNAPKTPVIAKTEKNLESIERQAVYASDSAVPAKSTASAYFHMGELLEATCWKNYFVALGNRVNGSFKEMNDLAASLGAPKSVMDDIARLQEVAEKIPFTVAPDVWTAEQKKLVASCAPRAEIWNDWLLDAGEDQYLYFWMGRFSLRAWFGVQTDVVRYHVPISERMDNIKSIVDGAKNILVDKRYETTVRQLSMESFVALKEMDSLRVILNTSAAPNGPTLAQINMLGNAGKKLRELSENGKLLKADYPSKTEGRL